MSPTPPPPSAPAVAHRIGGLGDPGTWLLSGPPPADAPEELVSHLARFGLPPACEVAGSCQAALRESGLQGRGGAGFPFAMKVDTAALAPGTPVVVVNAGESEPASRKDRVLCCHRPHLVLDGAATAARIAGADEVIVYLHRGASDAVAAVRLAIAERIASGLADPTWSVALGPDRYVAGESSAVASFVGGGEARPRFSPVPLAAGGPGRRPMVIGNAETMAHIGLIVRMGSPAWQRGGAPSSPGSRLVTVVGAVEAPGSVLELVGRATIGDLLTAAGCDGPPAAVLVGGYAGTWIEGRAAWRTAYEREALQRVGARAGCGLLGVLPHGCCGLAETAGLVRYLAAETAGQCGPCVNGLPRYAAMLAGLAAGSLRSRGLRRLASLGQLVEGGGACSHPDGAVGLVRSALRVFGDDVVEHIGGRPCTGAHHSRIFPTPDRRLGTKEWS